MNTTSYINYTKKKSIKKKMQFIVCQLYLDKTDFFFKDDSEKKK